MTATVHTPAVLIISRARFPASVPPAPAAPVRDNALEQHIYTLPAPLARGVWHSIVSVADFDWRREGHGGVTVWLDGKEFADYHGPFGYLVVRPPYFKFGIYRPAAPETLAVDYANIETSRISLCSRIHTPPAVCTAN